jgi:hypothetical protein
MSSQLLSDISRFLSPGHAPSSSVTSRLIAAVDTKLKQPRATLSMMPAQESMRNEETR